MRKFIKTELPEETMGMCAKKNCNNYTHLGDGYCRTCWDKGFGFDAQFPFHYSQRKSHDKIRYEKKVHNQQAIRSKVND